MKRKGVTMFAKDLMKLLAKCPQNLPVRMVLEEGEEFDEDVNYWFHRVEVSKKGESGFEEEGEIRIVFGE